MNHLTTLNYKDMTEAPAAHKRVMELTATGIDADQISSYMGIDYELVLKIQNHPAIQEAIRLSNQKAALTVAETKDKLNELLSLATNTLKDILSNDDSPKSLKLKAATEILDRHPSGEFTKKTSKESTEIRVVDATKIARIRKKGLELGNGQVYECIPKDNGSGGEVFECSD